MRVTLSSSFSALLLAVALVGCAQPNTPAPTEAPTTAAAPTEAPTTAAAPTEAPTTAAAPTEAPTTAAAPTEAPTTAAAPTPAAAAGVLPAPMVYVNDQNELARIEVDGATTTTLTNEENLIIDFALGPQADVIAFITIAESDQRTTLVRISGNGSERTELASGVIRGVTVAADGSVQAGVLFEAVGADGAALTPGTWTFPADGAAPTLLATGTEPGADGTPGIHYQPSAWAPDDSALLLRTSMNMGPDGPGGDIGTVGLALYERASGQSRELLASGQEWVCAMPVWSRDSAAILCANSAAIGAPTPTLWRLQVADGAQTVIMPATDPLVATFSPRESPEGIDVLAGAYQDSGLALTAQRVAPDGTTTNLFSQPLQTGFDGGLWAPDGSGVVYGRPTASANRTIVWQPFGAEAAVDLISGSIGKLEWVSP